jgi:hypothetical protein
MLTRVYVNTVKHNLAGLAEIPVNPGGREILSSRDYSAHPKMLLISLLMSTVGSVSSMKSSISLSYSLSSLSILSRPPTAAAFSGCTKPGECTSSVADPGSRCLFDPLDPGSGTGKKHQEIPDQIFENLETIFLAKILKLFDADTGWKKFRSGINIPDPHHCGVPLLHTYNTQS